MSDANAIKTEIIRHTDSMATTFAYTVDYTAMLKLSQMDIMSKIHEKVIEDIAKDFAERKGPELLSQLDENELKEFVFNQISDNLFKVKVELMALKDSFNEGMVCKCSHTEKEHTERRYSSSSGYSAAIDKMCIAIGCTSCTKFERMSNLEFIKFYKDIELKMIKGAGVASVHWHYANDKR